MFFSFSFFLLQTQVESQVRKYWSLTFYKSDQTLLSSHSWLRIYNSVRRIWSKTKIGQNWNHLTCFIRRKPLKMWFILLSIGQEALNVIFLHWGGSAWSTLAQQEQPRPDIRTTWIMVPIPMSMCQCADDDDKYSDDKTQNIVALISCGNLKLISKNFSKAAKKSLAGLLGQNKCKSMSWHPVVLLFSNCKA